MKRGEWTFLTNNGRILAYIAKNPRSTEREIAAEAGLTLRAVQKIIRELEIAGYLERERVGRTNHYTVHVDLPMRHPLEQDYTIGDVLLALGYDPNNGSGATGEG